MTDTVQRIASHDKNDAENNARRHVQQKELEVCSQMTMSRFVCPDTLVTNAAEQLTGRRRLTDVFVYYVGAKS